MRARLLVTAAAAAIVLTACSSAADPEPESPSEDPAAQASTPEVAGSYLDDNDVASHMACTNWTDPADDTGLSSSTAMSVAGRALRSPDSDMSETAQEAGIGPLVTDPWGLTALCEAHGYETQPGSLAEHYYSA